MHPKIKVKKTETHQVIVCDIIVVLLTWEASAQTCGLFTLPENFSFNDMN